VETPHKPATPIIGLFNEVADSYDRIGPRVFAHFGQRLVQRASLIPGARVLDVAAGRGAILFPAAERVGQHGRVIGIDLSSEMVRETTAEIRSTGCTNAEMREMSAEELAFPDGCFDAVTCGFALWFFPNPQRALSEFFRVLKPGGQLAVTTWASDSPIQVLYQQALRPYAPPPDPKGPTIAQFGTPEKIEAALTRTGFQQPVVYSEDAEFLYAAEAEVWAFVLGTAARRFLDRLSQPTIEQAKAELYKQLQLLKRPDGFHVVGRAVFGLGVRSA
jgi:ubiquinone/menaquinone biosynthesis C-methylase UbiE